jgi:hypothetical protein
MTDSTKTTNQAQSSTTNPYAPALPLVNSLISQYGSLNPGMTANQGGALTNLNNSVSNLPNFGWAGTGAINNLFSSAGSAPQVGMLNTAYDTLRTNLSPTASGANLDPYSTPGFGDALNTSMDDITNRVKSVYSASGRDPSGAGSFAQSLGRGLTQGVAPTIAGQYNTNFGNMVNANNSLFQGAGGTASSINNLRQGDTATSLAALQGAGAIPGLYAGPATAQLGAANAQYSQPFQNLSQLLGPSTALAGLGSNTQGTGNSTQTSTPSLMSTIGQGIGAAGTAASLPWGSIGTGLAAIPALFSDARLKTDIAKVGKLNDGQPVFSYRYKGDATPRIGLMAQETLKHAPEAVHRHPSGFLAVDYGAATRRSRVGALAA